MSRIGSATDRPIQTSEKPLATQQTSETESNQKTDLSGGVSLDVEHVAKGPAPTSESKGQQLESRLGELARQTELQSYFPVPSAPTLKDLPDVNRNLDPNLHLDEKIDVTKNLPDGKAINSGLAGLDWGIGKAKTGPNHMGVDLSRGGMKSPTDRIAEVLDSKKPGQSNTSHSERDARMVEKTGGVAGQIRSPKYDQISSGLPRAVRAIPDMAVGMAKDAKDAALWVVDEVVDEALGILKDFVRAPEIVKEVTGDAADLLRGVKAINDGGPNTQNARETENHDKIPVDKKYIDGDAAGVNYVPTSEEIARFVKTGLGHVEHGINPDLGVGGGHVAPKAEDIKDPMDRVKYPIDGDASAVEDSPKRGKLATEIHGPRTLNPDSGYEPSPTGGDIKGGGPDPLTGNPSE